MLQPKRTKYRKMHKGRNEGLSWRGNLVSFGEYGLKATETGQVTARQIIRWLKHCEILKQINAEMEITAL